MSEQHHVMESELPVDKVALLTRPTPAPRDAPSGKVAVPCRLPDGLSEQPVIASGRVCEHPGLSFLSCSQVVRQQSCSRIRKRYTIPISGGVLRSGLYDYDAP